MKRNLLTVALLALSISVCAQTICNVNDDGVFFVGENALVYNGGGLQTKGNGIYDVRGNVMVVGTSTDQFNTIVSGGSADKTDGGNFILRLNTPATSATSTYGQLFISGIPQGKMNAIVDKEYREPKHGTYQQLAMPFSGKLISSLSGSVSSIGTFGKTFTNARYSKNEVLTWNNVTAVSDNLNVSSTTPKNTTYYMFGTNNFDSNTPPATMPSNPDPAAADFGTNPTRAGVVYTLRGKAYSDLAPSTINETIKDAANGTNFVNFGTGGNNNNFYNEKYNTYLQDQFQKTTNPVWTSDFGRNIYQFGNPFLTNLDLSNIDWVEPGTTTDGNNLTKVWGVRYNPGTVVSLSNGSTYSIGALTMTYAGSGAAVGDTKYIIKPMQTFVLKMRDNTTAPTLFFNSLRRFSNKSRTSGDYSVTAGKGATTGTIKQLAIIGLDVNSNEIGRTYYVVSPNFTSGHQTSTDKTVQAGTSGANVLGTFEENAVTGGYDGNYLNYLLYINEANEIDFEGKAVPLAIYNTDAKKLRFEILEDGVAIDAGVHNLSTGIGFYYKASNGTITEINQNDEVNITSDEYGLYYGKGPTVLGNAETKANRTIVVYSSNEDNYIVQFDPSWKKASVKVYDMSGKLIINEGKVNTKSNYIIKLSDQRRSTYVVAIESENGEKVNTKILK